LYFIIFFGTKAKFTKEEKGKKKETIKS